MKLDLKRIARELRGDFTGAELNRFARDPRFETDFYNNNLSFCLAAGLMICILTLIGLVGTFAPFSAGYLFPYINATVVYAVILCANLIFMVLLSRERDRFLEDPDQRTTPLIDWFTGTNMALASLTFYTTQADSSFFFEYILVTIIIFLVPNSNLLSYTRNVTINLIVMVLVMSSFHYKIAWQDLVDIIVLHIICAIVTRIRWLSFLRWETSKFLMEKKRDEFYQESRTDGLTGLLNRTGLRDDFTDFIDQKLFVALIDLDAFKKYNDTYGHAFGDRVLELTGERIRKVFDSRADRCYRYGGDEFLIISRDQNKELFLQKLSEFQKICEQKKDGVGIYCSIGYCSGTPGTEQELRALIKTADDYLYHAKSEGTGKMEGKLSGLGEKGPVSSGQTSVLKELKDMDEAAELFYQEEMAGKEWSIAYLDINRYAEINDELGYREGRLILEKISGIILDYFPDAVLVNREVDHFVLHSTQPPHEFIRRIRKIQEAVSGIESRRMIIIRAGIYHHRTSDPPMDFTTGMYHAKYASDAANDAERSDRYLCVFDAEMERERARETFVHNEFARSLKEGRIVPYYQPVVGALSGTTCGFEALSRWVHPQKGIITPCDFVPYLEKMGETYRLDLCILEQVCRDISRNRKQLPKKLFVNVNLSQNDFQLVNMPDRIDQIVSRYGIDKGQIQFEITESAVADSAVLQESLQRLRDQGYRIWMDDFGVGESSLAVFMNNDVQGVKLDQSFFADVANQRTQIIIQSVIRLSRETKCMIIAEGIETLEQLRCAQMWGSNYVQGFYYSRPMPMEELLRSPFVRNLTDDCTDRFYQAVAATNLLASFKPCYNLQDLDSVLFARAVIEWGREIRLLRLNEPMQKLMRDSVRVDGPARILDEGSDLIPVLREASAKISADHGSCDFRAKLNQRCLHGQLTWLAEDPAREKTAYILNLTNFDVIPSEKGSGGSGRS
jgi:diguanylate cyclase (GGDEF)-like protein